MAEYIDREAFISHEESIYCKDCSHRKNSKGKMVYAIGGAPCRACGIMDVLDDVADYPAADVQPVEEAKWIWDDEGYHCSKCFFHAYGCTGEILSGDFQYCPHCGSDMVYELSEEPDSDPKPGTYDLLHEEGGWDLQ